MNDQRRILVTGAGGYLGRPLVRALEHRAHVLPATLDGRRADILNESDRAALVAGQRADTLVHLAWVTEHGRFWTSDANAAWQTASVDLFQRFRDVGGKRIIGVGTCAEYDWTNQAAHFAENAPLAPHTVYGAAKVATAEALAALDGDWAWGRIFFSFGPGEPAARLIPSMLDAVREGRDMGIGPGGTVRDFWHVDDVSGALAALALSPVTGAVNVASGLGTSFADLAAMASATGPGEIRPGSRPLGAGEPERLVADSSRLSREVGYTEQRNLPKAISAYAEERAAG